MCTTYTLDHSIVTHRHSESCHQCCHSLFHHYRPLYKMANEHWFKFCRFNFSTYLLCCAERRLDFFSCVNRIAPPQWTLNRYLSLLRWRLTINELTDQGTWFGGEPRPPIDRLLLFSPIFRGWGKAKNKQAEIQQFRLAIWLIRFVICNILTDTTTGTEPSQFVRVLASWHARLWEVSKKYPLKKTKKWIKKSNLCSQQLELRAGLIAIYSAWAFITQTNIWRIIVYIAHPLFIHWCLWFLPSILYKPANHTRPNMYTL